MHDNPKTINRNGVYIYNAYLKLNMDTHRQLIIRPRSNSMNPESINFGSSLCHSSEIFSNKSNNPVNRSMYDAAELDNDVLSMDAFQSKMTVTLQKIN